MSRHTLEIRDAQLDDAAALMDLWARAGAGASAQATPRPLDDATAALAQVAADPDERFLVGYHQDALVAALHLRRALISPLHLDMAIHTSYLLVAPEFRKHGFARALLESAVTWAEDKGVDHITSFTASGSRDTNRFLARLGLAPVATIRVAATGTLRRKLTPRSAREGQRAHLGRVLAQRRSIQRRAREEVAAVAEPEPDC